MKVNDKINLCDSARKMPNLQNKTNSQKTLKSNVLDKKIWYYTSDSLMRKSITLSLRK